MSCFRPLIQAFAAAVVTGAMLLPSSALATDTPVTAINTARFTLYFGKTEQTAQPDGMFVKNVADNALKILDDTLEEFTRVFNTRPKNRVVLRFLSPEEFRRQTGAPAWTSAMFYRGEITIPLQKGRGINFIELRRALRHEFVHAVVAELSDYRCPAWLDEGVAQLLEGQVNPLLGPALRGWIGENDAMPLAWLQNGFTTLDSQIVPAAYAQSLFATRKIIDTHGFSAVVDYLKRLGGNEDEQSAFEHAFKSSKKHFHAELTQEIQLWAKSDRIDP